ncbi:hypothetical protein L3Y34_010442 [Caenorhabditis briggsae]|uniref:Uncharacterized protein n=2 Tax=Caenorhabditis briggsae TaxID=6238 RepID=A0AAE8ZNH6_CAEBR|nr:hypothetical protein L3Y34_010442 [Caenorhabditis briggsae]
MMTFEEPKFESSLTSTILGSIETPSNIFLHVNPAEETSSKQEAETNITFESIVESTEDDHVESEHQLQLILDCILPPRVYEQNGKLWKQQASLHPATRLDMINLEEKLESELKDRGAKPFGICPIRRDLYAQFFDELIRQVSVSCAERGLLLVRVRDEIRMTFAAYQNVLESAIAYGVRKALFIENEQTRATTEWKVQKEKNKELLLKIAQLEKKLATDKIVSEEELEIVEQRMKDTNERLVEANRILKNQLQSILQMDDMSHVKVGDTVAQ